MKRGDLVAVRDRDGPASKARPCLVVQSDRAGGETAALSVCPLTSTLSARPLIRPTLVPTVGNGLHAVSDIEVDRIFSPQRKRIGMRIGEVDSFTMRQVDEALRRWLDL